MRMNFSENETSEGDLQLAQFNESHRESENENSPVTSSNDVVCSWMECCKNVYNDTFPEDVRINRTQYLINSVCWPKVVES